MQHKKYERIELDDGENERVKTTTEYQIVDCSDRFNSINQE